MDTKGEGASPLLCTPTARTSRPSGARPLPEDLGHQVCTHHRRTLTSSSETAAGSYGSDILSLISSLALSLAFSARKGNVGISLSACYILRFCEIRLCAAETVAK